MHRGNGCRFADTKGLTMKATLSFNLPEESTEHKQAVQAIDVLIVLDNFHNAIRSLDKYDATQDLSQGLIQAIQDEKQSKIDVVIEVRNMLFTMLADKGIETL